MSEKKNLTDEAQETVDLIDRMMQWEDGSLPDEDTVALFGELVSSGLVNALQGSYGRMAATLIRGGYLTPEGEVTDKELP